MNIGFYGSGEVKKRALLRLLDTHLEGMNREEITFHFAIDDHWTDSLDVVFDYALDEKIQMTAHFGAAKPEDESLAQLYEDFQTEGAFLDGSQDGPTTSLLNAIDQLLILFDEGDDETHALAEVALDEDLPVYDLTYGLRRLELAEEELPEVESPIQLLRKQVEDFDDAEAAAEWLADQDRDHLKALADELKLEYSDRARSTTIAAQVSEHLHGSVQEGVQEVVEKEPEPAQEQRAESPQEAPEVEVVEEVSPQEPAAELVDQAREDERPVTTIQDPLSPAPYSPLLAYVHVDFAAVLHVYNGDADKAIAAIASLRDA